MHFSSNLRGKTTTTENASEILEKTNAPQIFENDPLPFVLGNINNLNSKCVN